MIDARFSPLSEWPHKSTPYYARVNLGGNSRDLMAVQSAWQIIGKGQG